MIRFDFRLISSLEKVLPDQALKAPEQSSLTLFANERGSFQLAYSCKREDELLCSPFASVCVESDLGPALVCRSVGLVPSDYPCHSVTDEDYITTRPGLLPDLLRPVDLSEPVKVITNQWRALWFTVDAAQLTPGEHTIHFTARSGKKDEEELVFDQTFTVNVLECALPPQTLYHTEWFHADCLADYYKVPVFSEEHWRLIDAFMAGAARCGVNMLLTPVFTPPLDTAKGGERTTIQLVDITYENGTYSFGFEKLRRWVELCRKNGITEIEIAHLFTQWGAEFCPKIMVWENGTLSRRFGWDTPAVGGEYTKFLQAFLPALKAELASMDILDHTWFHISDEPYDHNKPAYSAAKNSVHDLLKGCKVIDALSSFALYQEGIVEKPVVAVNHIQPFLDHNVPGLWAYYCTSQPLKVPNRFMAMPSSRNRILGVLLYVFDIEGFLHWGLNFYNSQYSVAPIDPFRTTDSGEAFPSGDPFLLYPAPDGTAWDSIRSEVLYDAMQDVRMLRLAESQLGRERTLALVTEAAGQELCFDDYPRDPAFFERLRSMILDALN